VTGTGSGLVLDGITVRFGGLVAVDGLTLDAPFGRLTGLIGPNGAGKTTTFNVCSGLQAPAAGRVFLDDRDVTPIDAASRARLGLGRTFQRMELFASMTVAENVALGREAGYATRNPWRQMVASRAERRAVADAVDEALDVCGLFGIAGRRAADLSTGQRRLVELARAHASRFRMVLLDEPSSGLDPGETEELGRIIQRWVAELGMGVLLVEHDMALVMDVCQFIHVLDFGQLIFSGTPAEVRASPAVQAAYLGTGEAAEAAGVGGR
jgi:ABC-type branched-subunit amino acid transport system ATPase component